MSYSVYQCLSNFLSPAIHSCNYCVHMNTPLVNPSVSSSHQGKNGLPLGWRRPCFWKEKQTYLKVLPCTSKRVGLSRFFLKWWCPLIQVFDCFFSMPVCNSGEKNSLLFCTRIVRPPHTAVLVNSTESGVLEERCRQTFTLFTQIEKLYLWCFLSHHFSWSIMSFHVDDEVNHLVFVFHTWLSFHPISSYLSGRSIYLISTTSRRCISSWQKNR